MNDGVNLSDISTSKVLSQSQQRSFTYKHLKGMVVKELNYSYFDASYLSNQGEWRTELVLLF